MHKFTVKVWEEDCGTWTFTGVQASNKNEACARSIRDYMLFVEEIATKRVSATATLERGI